MRRDDCVSIGWDSVASCHACDRRVERRPHQLGKLMVTSVRLCRSGLLRSGIPLEYAEVPGSCSCAIGLFIPVSYNARRKEPRVCFTRLPCHTSRVVKINLVPITFLETSGVGKCSW